MSIADITLENSPFPSPLFSENALRSLDDSTVRALHDLLQPLYGLLDRLMVAMAASLGEASAAMQSVQQARDKRLFEQVEKQLDAASKNLFLKIFKPLMALLGMFMVMTMPIDVTLKVMLMTLLATMLAADLQQAVSGDNFLQSAFNWMAGSNEELATGLMIGFQVLVLATLLVAGGAAAFPRAADAVKNLATRLADCLTRSGVPAAQAGSIAERVTRFLHNLASLSRETLKQLTEKCASQMGKAATQFQRAAVRLSESSAWRSLAEKTFTQQNQVVMERFANHLMIAGGVVTGAMTFDRALLDIKLADMTFDVSFLTALDALLSESRKGLNADLSALTELPAHFEDCQDQAIAAFRHN